MCWINYFLSLSITRHLQSLVSIASPPLRVLPRPTIRILIAQVKSVPNPFSPLSSPYPPSSGSPSLRLTSPLSGPFPSLLPDVPIRHSSHGFCETGLHLGVSLPVTGGSSTDDSVFRCVTNLCLLTRCCKGNLALLKLWEGIIKRSIWLPISREDSEEFLFPCTIVMC